jgi:DNA-binding transcriptional LysR family regulator
VQSLVFFVHARHPLAKRRRLTLSDILAYPLVTRSEVGGPLWSHELLNQFSQAGFTYKVALECEAPMEVKAAVVRNIGVGLGYVDNLTAELATGQLVALKGRDFRFTTLSYIAYSKTRDLSPAARDFLASLRQSRQLPAGKNFDDAVTLKDHQPLRLQTQSGKSQLRAQRGAAATGAQPGFQSRKARNPAG